MKKRHIVAVDEDTLLQWLKEMYVNVMVKPEFDPDHSALQGLSIGESGDITFVVLEVATPRHLKSLK